MSVTDKVAAFKAMPATVRAPQPLAPDVECDACHVTAPRREMDPAERRGPLSARSKWTRCRDLTACERRIQAAKGRCPVTVKIVQVPTWADALSGDCTCHWRNDSDRGGWYLVTADPDCPAHNVLGGAQ
jgi:hypothetical protein